MSKTRRKNGQRVWEAWLRAAGEGDVASNGYATTRRIAEISGMSKPSVQRYMDILAGEGYVVKILSTKSMTVWGASEFHD